MYCSSTYHTHIDGKIEIVHKVLGKNLKCLVREKMKQWDHVLVHTESIYNSCINRSPKCSSLNFMHQNNLRSVLDMINFHSTCPNE